MDKKQLQDILSEPYQAEQWVKVLKDVFGVRNVLQKPLPISLSSNKKASAAFELGSFNTSDDRIIGLYLVKVKPEVWLERNKVGLRELLRSVYKYEVDGALIVFEQQDKWRLSFVSEIRSIDEDGSTTKKITEPKRYTYLLGKGEKTKTPVIRLASIAGKTISLEDIRNAFSVEALNEEFYKIIARHFYQLVGGTEGKGAKEIPYERVLKIPGQNNNSKEAAKIYREFAVRLIGRTVFSWFLKVKKSDAGISLLPEHLLSSEAVKKNKSYYHTILERLFFQTLNTPMDERVKHLPAGCEQIPFLNGGLFEPQIEDYYKPSRTTGLSENINTLKIPDDWFLDFFENLEQYNFTIDENSVVDIEVSVDPEMLGRIFENLLAEIDPDSGDTARKATGSFYTPREIVDYMATESLVHYLYNQTKIDKENLHPIFKIDSEIIFSKKDNEKILEALDRLKILDPACGSGAFPMGVLQKIVMALQKLDRDAIWWKARQISRIENVILKKQVREKLQQTTVEYARKIGVIQNSLYGVDIQPIAAEISKLRCFLTLIVDENIDETKPNRGVEPLPNLEFKFVTADSLLKLPEEKDFGGLFHSNVELDELQEIRLDYLQSFGEHKIELKKKFRQLQKKIFKQQLDFGAKESSRAYKISSWNPFSNEKVDWFDPLWMYGIKDFDVVIGNPPYVQLQKDESKLAKLYANNNYETYEKTGDVYALFYERAFQLLIKQGILCYITSNQWMRAGYGKSLRKYLSSQNSLLLMNLGPNVFQSATVDTNVYIGERNSSSNELKGYSLNNKKELSTFGIEDFISMSDVDETAWLILNRSEKKIRQVIEKFGKPLKKWNVKINRGVLTGLNDAFLITKKERIDLIKEDAKSKEIIKPLIRGRDVQKFITEFNDSYIIATFPSFNLNIDNYQAIKKHLKSFQPKLNQTGETFKTKDGTIDKTRKATSHKWFETQDPIGYKDEFKKEKVIWKRIGSIMRFSYSDKEVYSLDSTCIATGEKIKYLTAFLNSRFGLYQLFKTAPKTGMGDMIISVQALEPLLIYYPNNQQESIFVNLVDYILLLLELGEKQPISEHVSNSHIVQLFEEVIDALVYELYFEEDFKKADIYFMKYAERDFKSIEGLGSEEKTKTINTIYQKLREKNNEIRQNLKLMDTRLADLIMPIKTVK